MSHPRSKAARRAHRGAAGAAEAPALGPARPTGLAPAVASAHDQLGNAEALRALSSDGPATEALRAPVGNAELQAQLRATASPTAAAETAPAPGDEGLLASIVRRLSPLLGEVLDHGIVGTVGPDLGSAVSDFVDAQLEAVSLDPVAEAVLSEMGDVVGTLVGVVAADPACCQALEAWLSGLAGLGPDWMRTPSGAPLLDAVTRESPAFAAVGRVLAGDLVGLVAEVAPHVASTVEGIEKAIAYVVSMDAEAGQWLADKLGLENKGGVLGALRQIWEALVAAFDKVLAVVFALPGPRLAYAIVDTAHDLFEAAQWIADNWGDPDAVARAPEALADNVYRGFVTGGLAIARDLAQVVPAIVRGARDLADALDAMTGVPMFGLQFDVLAGLRDFAVRVSESPLWGEVTDIVGALVRFALGTAASLAELLFALVRVGTSPGDLLQLLASDVFAVVPDCYKAVVVDVMVAFVTKWFVSLGYAAVRALFGDVPVLADALYTAAVAFLDRVWAVPAEQKAGMLESILAFLFGLDPFAFAIGIGAGLAVGTVEGIATLVGATFGFVMEGIEATVRGAVVGGALLDTLGDRVFDRDEEDSADDEDPKGVADLAALAVDALEAFRIAFTDPASPLLDPDALAAFLGESVEGLFAGVGSVAGELAAAAIGSLANGSAVDYTAGYALGKLAGGVVAGMVAKRVAMLERTNVVFGLLAALLGGGGAGEKIAEALANRVIAAVFDLGRRIAAIPGLSKVAAKLAALAEALLAWIYRHTSDTVRQLAAFVVEALGFGEDEVRALIGRVLGADAAENDALVEKVVEVVDDLRGSAKLPDGFDPRKSAAENLEDLLKEAIKGLVGAGDDEDEGDKGDKDGDDEDEDKEKEGEKDKDKGEGEKDKGEGEKDKGDDGDETDVDPTHRRNREGDLVEVDVPVPERTVDQALRAASPEVRAAIAITTRMGASDFAAVAEEAAARIQRKIDVDWADVVARGAKIAAAQRDLLVWDLTELRTLPAAWNGPTAYAAAVATLVAWTTPRLQQAFPRPNDRP